MPDDNQPHDFHPFDKEPSTGTSSTVDTSEHADLHHRLEADRHTEATDSTQTADPSQVSSPAASNPVSAVPQASPVVNHPKPGPGLLVLQWLVYAFWGWTVLSVSVLVLLIVDQMINKVSGDTGSSFWYSDGVAYPLAAAIVLFFIALICDIFYARTERTHTRSNGSNVIMIIHAVLFALFGIGALIMSVFGGVGLLIGEETDGNGASVSIVAGVIIAIIYGMTLLRTLRPGRIKNVVQLYWAFMTITLIAAIFLGITGPAAYSRLRAQDQIIETELPVLARAINEYTQTNGSLPKDLNAVTDFSGADDESFSTITSKKLVEYKPGEKLSTTESAKLLNLQRLGVDQLGGTAQSIYHYQLCVTYKTSDGASEDYDSYSDTGNRYSDSVSTYGHKPGKKCYDVQTDYQYQS